MKTRWVVGAVVIILAACGSGEESAQIPTQSPDPFAEETPTASGLTILAFGDSLTAGFGVEPDESYPAQLQAKLRADGYSVDVINGGISGDTSAAALTRVDWMLNTKPDIVIVEIGGNDALRGLDLTLTKSNIDEIVRKFTESGAVVIVAGMQIIQNLGDEYVNTFAAIYPAVADNHGAILIPFFLEGVAADPVLNQPDFIHPNSAGYSVLIEHIYPYVVEAIEQVEKES